MVEKDRLNTIAKLTGLTRQTISKTVKKFTKLLSKRYYSNIPKIGGPGIVVEIDESKFGKVKFIEGIELMGFGGLEWSKEHPEDELF